MNDNDKVIIDLSKKYNLVVSKSYALVNDRVEVVYMIINEYNDCVKFFESDDFKSLNMGSDEFSKRLFELYDIRHSQENEFYID
jgi:hypothetical protein